MVKIIFGHKVFFSKDWEGVALSTGADLFRNVREL